MRNSLMQQFTLDDIWIRQSASKVSGRFHLHAEFAGHQFDGFFDDLGGFLQAVSDLGTFIGVRTGKIRPGDARYSSTRDITPIG